MIDQELADLAERDLVPLLAARDVQRNAPRARRRAGGRDAPGNRIWIAINGWGELTMSRSLPLTPWEAAILDPYGQALADLRGIPAVVSRHAKDDVVLRAIAAQLGNAAQATVESGLRFLLSCAAATYEGEPIHINLLLDLGLDNAQAPIPSLDDYRSHDWFPLLGSGLDSGIVIDSRGRVVDSRDLRGGTPEAHGTLIDDSLRPDAFRAVGEWTRNAGRVALSLARSRELLIHQEGELRYIYRSGRWRGLPMQVARSTGWAADGRMSDELKTSVLASAIDASMGHHGACIAVIARGQKLAFEASAVVSQADQWPINVRARLFPTAAFRNLTRRQRLEILSMDGATVLDHEGNILAAGAIVQVPGGSSGGGRLAAARTLARFGAALKISQDGPITLFGRRANGQVEQLISIA